MADSEVLAGAILERSTALLPEIVALRRAIHADPELGLSTPRTSAKVRAALDGLPFDYREGGSTTGMVAILQGGGGEGRRVLLRGDMDALPMAEDTGLPFASQIEGTMHACGHDAHTAMLVGAARLLAARKDRLRGTVMFMFQPGEEGHHGARHMLDDGLLEPLPDAAFALHVMPNAPHGVLSGKAGPLLASADKVRIRVVGKGGHASMPHDAIDPVPIACEIVMALQAHVTRAVPVFDPAVVTIGKIEAGTTDNVVPETAFLLGTIRTLSPERRKAIQQGIQRVAVGIGQAHGASVSVEFEQGFPVTVCDPQAVSFGQQVAHELFGAEGWQTLPSPIMGAEDFSYVLEKVPGAMFFLGASAEGSDWQSCCPVHSNRMVLDESVMARGMAFHAAIAERFLERGF